MSRKERRKAYKAKQATTKRALEVVRSNRVQSDEVQVTLTAAKGTMLIAVKQFLETLEADTERTILVVARGDAPMAEYFVHPEVRLQGSKGVMTALMAREALVQIFANGQQDVADALCNPLPCGHLELFVATRTGGAMKCVHCDLGIGIQEKRARVAEPSN